MIAEVAVFCWHVHHFVQVEPLWEPIEERIDYIKKNKPASEQELRLRLLQEVQSQLPIAVLQAGIPYVQAREAVFQAGVALNKAWVAYDQTPYDQVAYSYDQAINNQTWEAYFQARVVCNQTREALILARKDYLQVLAEHSEEINALHAQECPDCPWDGKPIFGRGGE